MATNRKQAVAILNQQCQKYFGDPEVKESINKERYKPIFVQVDIAEPSQTW